MEKKPSLINFKKVVESRGITKIIEAKEKKLFNFKRIYFISDVPKNEIRGQHAHYKTKQILLVLNGQFTFGYFVNNEKKVFEINVNKKKMVFIPNYCWHWMENFSNDCILCVAASTFYDKKDYIYSYQSLLEIKE